jgi:hypothetical protein
MRPRVNPEWGHWPVSLVAFAVRPREKQFVMTMNSYMLHLCAFLTATICLLGVPALGADASGAVAPKSAVKVAAKATVLPADLSVPSSAASHKSEKGGETLETYHDLITKAQNLTLQRDRLQTSQVLTRGIRRETRGTAAYKELVRTLEELTSVFYTEKAQGLYASAGSLMDAKPREAIDVLQEALRLEDSNLTLLEAVARLHLRLGECDKADVAVVSAENVDAFSPAVKLLRLQTLSCQKNFDLLGATMAADLADLEPLEKYLHGLQIDEQLRKKDFKKAKTLLTAWETQTPSYPEVYYWKWRISEASENVDRAAVVRYTQLCQGMTPRKRKSFEDDVELCRGREAADLFLKDSGKSLAPSGSPGEG